LPDVAAPRRLRDGRIAEFRAVRLPYAQHSRASGIWKFAGAAIVCGGAERFFGGVACMSTRFTVCVEPFVCRHGVANVFTRCHSRIGRCVRATRMEQSDAAINKQVFGAFVV